MADPNDNFDIDDLFESSEGEQDDLFSSDVSETSAPDLDVTASSSIAESDAIGVSDSFPLTETLEEIDERAEAAGKKGKKAKKEKAKKEKPVKPAKAEKKAKAPKEPKQKVAKAKKVKEPKEKGPITDQAAANATRCLGILLIVAIALSNVAAFIVAGPSCIMFLILFDILGLIALLVPFFMLNGLRKRPLSLFDAFLAIAAIFSVVACMILLAQQAKTYGTSIKAAFNAPAAVETFDC